MIIIDLTIGKPRKEASVLLDSQGKPVPLDILWTNILIKTAFENWDKSILTRTNPDITPSVFSKGNMTYSSVTLRRPNWVRAIIEAKELLSGGTGRKINKPELDTVSMDSGALKALPLEYTGLPDLKEIGGAETLAAQLKQTFNNHVFSVLEARAHYGMDFSIRKIDGQTDGGANKNFLEIWDQIPTDEIELGKFVRDLELKGNKIVHTVTKWVQRISKKNVVIELNLDIATAIKDAKNTFQRNSIGDLKFDEAGDIIGVGGYKVFVDTSQPAGCFARVRWMNTLTAAVGYDMPWTFIDDKSNEPAHGQKYNTILGAIDLEFTFAWFSSDYYDSLIEDNDPENAKFTPYYGNPNPQIKPFSDSSKETLSSFKKENLNNEEIINETKNLIKKISLEELKKLDSNSLRNLAGKEKFSDKFNGLKFKQIQEKHFENDEKKFNEALIKFLKEKFEI